MFICLDAHDPMTIVDTKDGVIEKQPRMSMNNIMAKGYKVLGLLYKNSVLDVDKKYIGSNLKMEVINPRETFKGIDLIIIRSREQGIIYGIKTSDGKEAFRTTDKKFVDAKELNINYLKQTDINYIVTFNYDGNTEVVTYVSGKRQNKLAVATKKSEPRINVTRQISYSATETKSFNKSIVEKKLAKMNIKAHVVGDKDFDSIKGYVCETASKDEYWVLADGRIYKGKDGSYKIFYKPESLIKKDKEESAKKLSLLIQEYNKASAMCESEAKGMEKAICDKLGIQRIVSMTRHNGYADLVVVVEDMQRKAQLDFRTCKLKML